MARRVVFALLVAALAGPATASAAFKVAVTRITIPVAGQPATGLLFEPYRAAPGDVDADQLVVYARGLNDEAKTNANYLEPVVAATGAAVVAMDYRGFKQTRWPVTTGAQDTVAAAQWFKARHPDVRRTVLWGWSMGGLPSGIALADAPAGLFDYWVSSFGLMNDFGAWTVLQPLGYGAEIEADAGGCTPAQCPDAYRLRTPSMRAAEMDAKRVFFVHGIGDPLVPYEQSHEMEAALNAVGTPTTFYTVMTDTDGDGNPVGPAGHGQPSGAALTAMELVQRILTGAEPLDGPSTQFSVAGASKVPPELLTPIPDSGTFPVVARRRGVRLVVPRMCVDRGGLARVRVRGGAGVRRIVVRARGLRVGTGRRASVRVPRRAGARVRVRARVTLADGRRRTLRATLRACR